MDDTAVTAILAVPADLLGTDTEKFFDVIIDVYAGGDGPGSLDEFVALVGERDSSFTRAAEEYRENLRAEGVDGHWADIARSLTNEAGSGARLVDLYEQLGEEAGEQDGEQDEAEADSVGWEAFCAENRDFWRGWDGTDWDAWRSAFADGAAGAGVGEDLAAHLEWMDGLDAAGRMAYLRDTLGFAVDEQVPDGAEPGEAPEEETQVPAELAGEIGAQVPGFEQLSDEEIAAVVAEVLQEAEV